MARAKKDEAPPGKWKYITGRKPHTVTAFERADKGCTVWLRWTRAGTGLYDKQLLGYRIRDERGRIDQDRRTAAEDAANQAYDRLLRGEDPRTPKVATDPTGAPALTIAAGLECALAVPDGMYPTVNNHTRDMRRDKVHVLAHLPPDVQTWDQITSVTYEQLWKRLAHWRVRLAVRTRTGEIAGKRAAELCVVLLAQAGRWLARAGRLANAPKEPAEKWGEKFTQDWACITRDAVVERDQPRHSPEELGRLFSALDAGLGDPRFRLALRTAGEARLGQALRCDRSALDLSDIGAHALGRFVVPDTGKKKGVRIDLTPALRAAWDHELTDGYLRDLEAAFRVGAIRTFPLFPGRRLVGGRARADVVTALGKRAATDLFHDLERAANVAVVDGRGWYGVRRIAADLAEDVEADGRALNAITGHQSDEMRRRIYQQKRRDAVTAKASAARERARAVAIDAAAAAADRGPVAVATCGPSHWEQARDAKRLRRLLAHPVPTGRKKGGKRARLAAAEGAAHTATAAHTEKASAHPLGFDLPPNLPPT